MPAEATHVLRADQRAEGEDRLVVEAAPLLPRIAHVVGDGGDDLRRRLVRGDAKQGEPLCLQLRQLLLQVR
ncbi:hypothetical protein LZL79_28710 [Pseudomonas aeruginosa]|nr:hypothetical protein [Pseudomonas aeruginosa]